MTTLPTLDVKVDTRKWSCVLDVALALSPWGLMFPWRFAEVMNVWLVPSFWELLDGTDLYLDDPQALQAEVSCLELPGPGLHVSSETLGQWKTAREEADLPGVPIYWAGDRRHESRLPAQVDGDLTQDFMALGRTLDARRHPREPFAPEEPANLFEQCFRDAAALAAALGRHHPVIFTLGAGDGQPPLLCRYLAACGVPCREGPRHPAPDSMQHHLQPALLRSGVAELAWAGLSLAAVHLVAPRAFLMPRQHDPDVDYPDVVQYARTLGLDGDWWDDAVAFWYPLTWAAAEPAPPATRRPT